MSKPELISFELCPFVQRSVITLLEKDQEFDITYIDLANKPEWFLNISPSGKVPVLRIGDSVVFESAVINEYLDETTPPSLHPNDPLKKAVNRAWIEFSSQLNMDMFHWLRAEDKAQMEEKQSGMMSHLKQVEDQLGEGPFFNGETFRLVDAAYAPYFMRLELIADKVEAHCLESLPKCLAWHTAMKEKESVIKSVIPTFKENFLDYVAANSGYISKSM
ncbi:MAG: glutathione S-transferase family protein [Candidatus Margulisbacteria bacterium]|nr:glutathione S-transferase family protein [Candidatus Margulisiibacteriota bacterium]